MRKLMLVLLVLVMVFPVLASAESETMQILLVGTDALGDVKIAGQEDAMGRADAIYVMQLGGEGEIKLLGIERDYLVTLPEGHGDNKLATATFFGGPKMLMEAVNKLLGLKVTNYVQIDIEKAIQAVDMIGGIDVEVNEDEVEPVNEFIKGMLSYSATPVKVGINHLDGHAAWAFAGMRNQDIDNIESNAQRNDRQRKVVRALINKLQELSTDEAIELVTNTLGFVSTNITMNDILTTVDLLQNSDTSQFVYLRSPSTGFEKKRVGMHQVVVAQDVEAEKNAVRDFLAQ